MAGFGINIKVWHIGCMMNYKNNILIPDSEFKDIWASFQTMSIPKLFDKIPDIYT